MAAPALSAEPARRADIAARTLRQDRWWVAPAITFTVLGAFVLYGIYAAIYNADYFVRPLISPFYSPCIATVCDHARFGAAVTHAPTVGIVGTWWPVSPAILILIFPLGFRLTCYYYRRAYYRSFWLAPPACAVSEPHKSYSGETRFPLILQNVHRYFLYFAALFAAINTYDAVVAFRDVHDKWGHMSVGTLVLVANAVFLWSYTLGCHSCRHIIGGRLRHFSKHPIRFRAWGIVSWFNQRHMQMAWISLVVVALADLYVRLVASGWIHNPYFF
jgi:hypothetical protein